MYQFVRPGFVAHINLRRGDMNILRRHGWVFITLHGSRKKGFETNARTCVDLSKRALGIHSLWIQTPLALYKHIRK